MDERTKTRSRRCGGVRWFDRKGGRKEDVLEWMVEAGEEVTTETEWDVKATVSLWWVESV
jgi:hypothetical protein